MPEALDATIPNLSLRSTSRQDPAPQTRDSGERGGAAGRLAGELAASSPPAKLPAPARQLLARRGAAASWPPARGEREGWADFGSEAARTFEFQLCCPQTRDIGRP